jgi:hypothetical protein
MRVRACDRVAAARGEDGGSACHGLNRSLFKENRTYKIRAGSNPSDAENSGTNPHIEAAPNPGGTWSFAPAPPAITCSAANVCSGLSVTLNTVGTSNVTPDFTGSATLGSQSLNITVTRNANSCTTDFTFMGTSSVGGGWGAPHVTTVDGIEYDFQSAGEFTALREDRLVIQTRQSPVPTATVPITSAYTGITHCVAIYTAVAAKLGSTRVTVQPSPGAEPDPNSMQVRVNGKVVTIGDAPYVLRSGDEDTVDGTITKHPDGMFEITDALGTQLVVTSSYWGARKVWHLNVGVYGTSAHQGTMGRLAESSWLPALPDGSSLGAKPASESERYQALYEKFADAWRVTNATSLFDYEAGTSTASFTRDEWPRNDAQSCAINGQTSAQAATPEVAQQACANVVGAARKADCVFDVMVTGNAGFGKSYEVAQRFSPLPGGWYTSPDPGGGSGGAGGSGDPGDAGGSGVAGQQSAAGAGDGASGAGLGETGVASANGGHAGEASSAGDPGAEPNGGVGDPSAAGAPDRLGDAGSPVASSPTTDPGNCACRMGAGNNHGSAPWSTGAWLALLLTARRRRARAA